MREGSNTGGSGEEVAGRGRGSDNGGSVTQCISG
jgi:hypothetical protein